eukprot:TRINITY_DN24009_c0_g1_i1.p1 TRINITY_DN24009_c0_g1~~TRINITY_DN24009_c0_g1_i1.p1  ORF type:complete len:486 (+),score=90.24 TRINITY_DN24009_c0_g1_i1:57-1460(+)
MASKGQQRHPRSCHPRGAASLLVSAVPVAGLVMLCCLLRAPAFLSTASQPLTNSMPLRQALLRGSGGRQAPRHRTALRGEDSTGASKTERRAALLEMAEEAAKVVATALAAVTAFYVGAKIAVVGQPRRPELDGSFQTIGSRIVSLGGLRCRVLYPAVAGSGAGEASYLSEGTKTSDAMARLVFFPGFLLEHLGAATSGCLSDAEALRPPQGGGYPVLIYSHGQGGNMDMGMYFLREIASQGIIVVSVEHQDGSASTADAGNPRPFSLTAGQLGTQYRAKELVSVTKDSLAPGGLVESLGGDKTCVLVGGHSYGGPTAIIAANVAPQLFQGLVLHDPALGSPLQRPVQPVFSVVGDQYAGISNLVREVRYVSTPPGGKASAGGEWAGAWHYEGISHGNFVDAPLWAPLIIMRLLGFLLIPAAGPADPAEAHAKLARAAATFTSAIQRGTAQAASTGMMQPAQPFKPL